MAKFHQLFTVGAAGDLGEKVPEGLQGYGTESHWPESMKRLNSATGLLSPECVVCCPCFVCKMMVGGGMKEYLGSKVHGVLHDLNFEHYEGVTVFANEGLKVTFDRNLVPYSKRTKDSDGNFICEKKKQPETAPSPTVAGHQVAPAPQVMQQVPMQQAPMQRPMQQAQVHPQQIPVQQVVVQQHPHAQPRTVIVQQQQPQQYVQMATAPMQQPQQVYQQQRPPVQFQQNVPPPQQQYVQMSPGPVHQPQPMYQQQPVQFQQQHQPQQYMQQPMQQTGPAVVPTIGVNR